MNLVIEGERIRLRQLNSKDLNKIYEYFKDEDVRRFTVLPNKEITLKGEKEFLKKAITETKKGKTIHLAIELKQTKEFIGIISLKDIDTENKRAEAGYWSGKPFWKQGFAKEAMKLLIDFAFNEPKLKLERIEGKVYTPNINSWKMLESIGFKREGEMKHYVFSNRDGWLDCYIYAILK